MPNGTENETSKKINFKPIHIIIAVVILILSFGGAFLIGKTVFKADADSQSVQAKSEKNTELGPLFESPEFTVNLANTNGRRFLMTQFSLEVNNEKVLSELEEKLPVVQDKVIIVLSSQTVDDLNSANGKAKIKQQLKDNLNEILSDGKILNIYFNNFVWQ